MQRLDITYEDTGSKKKNFQKLGFLIEPISKVAGRNDAEELDITMVGKVNVMEDEADQMALFQYMIGNTDWKIKGKHNLKFIKDQDVMVDKIIPVPYDFDFSGIVGAPYSFPQTWTTIDNVSEREYIGYCREKEEIYIHNIQKLIDKKEDILNVISKFEHLPENEKLKVLKYIKEFYKLIDKPERFVRVLKKECKDNY